MASAWGESWGTAWGDSWGEVGVVPQPEPQPEQPSVDRPWGQPQPLVIIGTVDAVLPQIKASARGYHDRVGRAVAQFGRLTAKSQGRVGAAGTAHFELGWSVESRGRVDIAGRVVGELVLLPAGRAIVGRSGEAQASFEISGKAVGSHDPDERAIMAFLQAA